MIPKKIHYFWFGNNPKSELILQCIDSWKKYMPDYEIIEWNESNFDVHSCVYIDQAYSSKKWAFASDYARFDILNRYGGIYLDTDVELLKSIPDNILNNKAFTGLEPNGLINPGLIFGAEKAFPFVSEMVEKYKNEPFLDENGVPKQITVNEYFSELLRPYGFKNVDKFQIVDGLAIYPSSYFCGFDLDVMEVDLKPETISVHHYAGTWNSKSYKRKVQMVLKKMFGVEGYRKILGFVRKIRKNEIKNKR